MNNKSALRVVLLEKDNDMQTIILPVHKAGQYMFYERNNSYEYPIIIIEGVQEKWLVRCVNNCRFDGINCDIFDIQGSCALLVLSKYKQYFMYVEEIEENARFIPYYIEPNNEIIIGRSENCDIYYPNLMIGREHVKLFWDGNYWIAQDLQSKNGVYVNGHRQLKETMLNIGDTVYILGLYIIVGVGFVSMNNSDGRVIINNSKIHEIKNYSEISYSKDFVEKSDVMFDRVTRSANDLSADEIEFELPPAPLSNGKMPMFLRLGSQALYGGRALATGNIFSAVSSLLMPALTQGFTEKDRKEYEKKRKEIYSDYLERKKEEIENEICREEKLLEFVYPKMSTALEFIYDKKRLWERRTFDEDFLSIRVGHGNIPLMSDFNYPKRKIRMEEDKLLEDMYDVTEKKYTLKDAPVMLNLKKDYIIGITGSRLRKLELINNIIMQLVITHSYDEVKLVLLIEEEDRETFDYVRYLPHNWNNDKTIRFFCSNLSDIPPISKYLNKRIDEISDEKNGKTNQISYVIIATNKKLYESIECLKNIEQNDNYSNISIVAAFNGAPKESTKILESCSGTEYCLIDLYNSENQDITFELDEASFESKLSGMKEIMHTKLNIEGMKYTLPSLITFLDLYKVGKVEYLNLLNRWKENNPVKSLAVPIGFGNDGNEFLLDLHEKYHGPHGLIAGGTGSGKSEFIITYILSMAVNFSPDEVAFLLIDYKGGGLADAFVNDKKDIHLPHVVGTITNLDGAAISRSLLSINSELKRRQRLFKEAKGNTDEDTMDIYDYQKMYRNGKVSEPLPHLFIISDEFAELKKQEPEFMNELISIARIGRSLGVHLILATQKPTGVVNDQIWSNTKFRICLRVATKSDSMEMLKRPEAAEIKGTGRFYLQVGYNELFALGQSAWCGADYIPQDEVITETDNVVEFLDNTGQTIIEARPPKKFVQSEGKQIVSIVKYISDLAKNESIVPKQLWCEPLSDKIDWDELKSSLPENLDGIKALIGKIDDPKNQRQFEYIIDMLSFRSMFICGNSGSGKSSFIKTMLYSLVTSYSPEWINYYILDLSGGSLKNYSRLPHCGAYLTDENEADFLRLMTFLKDIIAERKKKFLQNDVTTYENYIKANKMPLILVVIDSYANILSFKSGNSIHSGLYESIRESGAYGIRFVLSVNHLNELHSRTRQEIDYRVALRAKDRYEYTDILETRATFVVPDVSGRGMCKIDDETYEYHVAITDAYEVEQQQSELLRKRIDAICENYKNNGHALILPMSDGNERYAEFCDSFEKSRIPLGYHLKDMKKVALPLQQLYCMAIYLGNKLGRKAVFENILYAAKKNKMKTIIIKRTSDSVFDSYGDVVGINTDTEPMIPSVETMCKLEEIINSELINRAVYRNEFCEKNGILKTDKKRNEKASKYIREKTEPLLFLFESLPDIARLDIQNESVRDSFEHVCFSMLKGFNIYFMAGFYPEDKDVQNKTMIKNFIANEMSLIFGGAFDKQYVITPAGTDIISRRKTEPKYDNFIMKYRDGLYQMRMPCGELILEENDSDEASIV